MYGKKKEYGDYQTPYVFAESVCQLLQNKFHITPRIVVEPTCGIGNFLKASLCFNAKQYFGIEVNSNYCDCSKAIFKDNRVEIINEDFFKFDFISIDIENSLFIGNPPWITNSELSRHNSNNLPQKSNIKSLRGFDALTGASNFDVCEFMILHLVDIAKSNKSTIAMLCKTSVARNIFAELSRKRIQYSCFNIFEFDSKRVFNISASACLLVIQFNETVSSKCCKVYNINNYDNEINAFVYSDGQIKSKLETAEYFGHSCFEWRQGVKHDCSKIMELTFKAGCFYNGNNEIVEIENEYVFPLVKSSMFKHSITDCFSKFVIVTQSKARADTSQLKQIAPKLWHYLCTNRAAFEKRKSIIYRNAPDFSMFGVGDYSFAKYKVGISGFYKTPVFSLLYDKNEKPVMTDDTAYFICFPSYNLAYVAMLCLNSKKVNDSIIMMSFQDAKRPFTKQLLSKIDFNKIITSSSVSDLQQTENKLGLANNISLLMYNEFCDFVSHSSCRK